MSKNKQPKSLALKKWIHWRGAVNMPKRFKSQYMGRAWIEEKQRLDNNALGARGTE